LGISRINLIKERLPLQNANLISDIGGQGDRRSGIERRKISIPGYHPERRSGQDRRKSQQSRNRYDPEAVLERSYDRYMESVDTFKGMSYGFLLSLPIWAAIIFLVMLKVWF
jgi:hypothetical protein